MIQLENLIKPDLNRVYLESKSIPIDFTDLKPIVDAINEKSINFEDYFGKNKNVQKIVLKNEEIIRQISSKTGSKLDPRDLALISTLGCDIERILEKMLNVETVSLIITPGKSINTVPVGCGQINLTPYLKYSDKDAIKLFNEFEVTSDGIRYKYKDSKHIIIYIGVSLYAYADMKPEFITALMFREIGKSFINFTFGYSIQFQRCIISVQETFDIYNLLMTIISQGMQSKEVLHSKELKDIIELVSKQNPSDEDYAKSTILGMKLGRKGIIFFHFFSNVIGFIKSIPNWFKRLLMKTDKVSQEDREKNYEALKNITVNSSNEKMSQLAIAWEQLGFTAGMLFTLATSGIHPAKVILSLTGIDMTTLINKTYSDAGDKFPTYYGLGPEYAEAMLMYDKINQSTFFEKSGLAKPFRKIPFLNIISQLPWLTLSTIENAATGNKSTRSKIKSVYNDIIKELEDPNINPKLKKDLQYQLDEINKLYNNYIDPKTQKDEDNAARSFVYYAFRYFFKLKEKKPADLDNVTASLIGIDTLKESKDIINDLNLSNNETGLLYKGIEQASLPSMESTNYNALDMEIDPKQYLDNFYYKDIGVNFESYMGKSKVVQNSISHIKEIRALFPQMKAKLSDTQKREVIGILLKWGDEIAEEFNVESCTIGLEDVYNAYAFPMYIGNSSDMKAQRNNDIVETNDGFKFERKNGIHLICIIGTKLLSDIALSDELIAGLLFHEIGHGFQQFEGLSVFRSKMYNIYSSFISNMKILSTNILNAQIFKSLSSFGNAIYDSSTSSGANQSRTKLKKEVESGTVKTLDNLKNDYGVIKTNAQSESNSINILTYLILLFKSTIVTIFTYLPLPGISSFIITLCYDPFILPDLLLRGHYFRDSKKNERFADSFAAKYGLGSELSRFFIKINEMSLPEATKIPILRTIEQFNTYTAITMLSLIEDHPSNRDRIANVRDTLNKELLNNPNLSKSMKDQIQKELNEIDQMYDDITNPKTYVKEKNKGVGLFMWTANIFLKFKKDSKTIEDFSSDVQVSKVAAISTAFSSLKSEPIICEKLGVSKNDIDEFLNTKSLAMNELINNSL